VEKYCRDGHATDGNLIRRMSFGRWMIYSINTHSEYVKLIACALQQWLRERASTLRYTYIFHIAHSALRSLVQYSV
jgi:hypothetical protein